MNTPENSTTPGAPTPEAANLPTAPTKRSVPQTLMGVNTYVSESVSGSIRGTSERLCFEGEGAGSAEPNGAGDAGGDRQGLPRAGNDLPDAAHAGELVGEEGLLQAAKQEQLAGFEKALLSMYDGEGVPLASVRLGEVLNEAREWVREAHKDGEAKLLQTWDAEAHARSLWGKAQRTPKAGRAAFTRTAEARAKAKAAKLEMRGALRAVPTIRSLESWLRIADFPDYAVSSHYRVVRLTGRGRGLLVRPTLWHGKLFFQLWRNGRREQCRGDLLWSNASRRAKRDTP